MPLRPLRARCKPPPTGPGAARYFCQQRGVLRSETRVQHRGWRLVSFTRYDGVREQVNGVLALVIMGLRFAAGGVFYLFSAAHGRKARSRANRYELRALNKRLQREIAARQKAQQDLNVAEQTLAQSSKLAVLGEMSAAVSHELNQPLAAMKTYLAGARLLLNRRRPEEALVSFQRLDDLIDRMGAITRQLKSFARKGGDAFEPLDLRACVADALAMMEPRLRESRVLVVRTLPAQAGLGHGRPAAAGAGDHQPDAQRNRRHRQVNAPQIDLILTEGDTVTLTVRDNGPGSPISKAFLNRSTPRRNPGRAWGWAWPFLRDCGRSWRAADRAHLPDGGAAFDMALPVLREGGEARRHHRAPRQWHPNPRSAAEAVNDRPQDAPCPCP
jgi:two-component system, NtrC family, C4-dicarboxylate transport sensor histidine kinase DctB